MVLMKEYLKYLMMNMVYSRKTDMGMNLNGVVHIIKKTKFKEGNTQLLLDYEVTK
jgi:hypothetical protein